MTMKSPILITSDWHLRDTTPECRIDDYWEAQCQKIKFIVGVYNEHGCELVIHGGDLFDKAKPSNQLVGWTIRNLQGTRIVCSPGNHDLPYHNIDLIDKSGLGVLIASGLVNCSNMVYNVGWEKLFSCAIVPWKKEITKPNTEYKKNILVTHKLICKDKDLWPGIESTKAVEMLKKYPEYDVIVTGDNHQNFMIEHEGRKLINPGSLMRVATNQEQHKPSVYLLYEDNIIKEILIPVKQGVINKQHIEKKKGRDLKMESFLKKLKNEQEISLSFKKNMDSYLMDNNVPKDIEKIIWGCVE